MRAEANRKAALRPHQKHDLPGGAIPGGATESLELLAAPCGVAAKLPTAWRFAGPQKESVSAFPGRPFACCEGKLIKALVSAALSQ